MLPRDHSNGRQIWMRKVQLMFLYLKHIVRTVDSMFTESGIASFLLSDQ